VDGRYQLKEELGSGNTGTVYRAHHRDLGREVAVKLITLDFVRDRDELLSEARKLASLDDHENVVKVWDAGDWDDRSVYVASEYCPGGSLEDISKAGLVDPGRACCLVSDVCRGLDHVHRGGLLHLDIRPANVLIGSDGKPKLIDFGLARWTHDPAVAEWYWPHAAPELVEACEGRVATDIYGTAMTLAHLLTGGDICRPFLAGAALVEASANGDWPRLEKLGPNVPKKLQKVISQAVEYDPTARQATIQVFKRQLDGATPAVSFAIQADGTLTSTTEGWVIRTVPVGKTYDVEVRKRGRRRNELGAPGLAAPKARGLVRNLVKGFAYPKK
jgi:serine/threonine protein kinase